MIKLHVVQAEYGDCFVLQSKFGKNSINVLIDGGPYQTFDMHLKPMLEKLLQHDKIDLMILSHIDNDHIIGLLDLLVEIKNQRESGKKELVKIDKIWHNSFNDILEFPVESHRLLNLLPTKKTTQRNRIIDSLVMKGFQQGTDLAKLANSLRIPINPNFDKIIVVHEKIRSIQVKDIIIHLLGPTKKNVDKLQKEWNNWIKKKKTVHSAGALLQILDKSVPNLASIAFLVKTKNRKILFTGDALGQDIIDMLSKNAMLDKNGKFFVDVLKVPHHGSDRNTSQEFFEAITAKYYVISANGRDDNPSLNTLRWIIESGKTSQDSKKIIFTNITSNVKEVLLEYDQEKYNYEVTVLERKSHFITINLK
jgi:beta-lactamase superfamily II metal-dependent hydrolase